MGLPRRAPYHHPHVWRVRHQNPCDRRPPAHPGRARVVSRDRAGLEVVAEASNGEEASSKYREVRPDIVLMDLSMPVMDGLAATRAILDEFPDARVIVLTTYDGDEDIHRALDAGARGYLAQGHGGRTNDGVIRTVYAGPTRHPARRRGQARRVRATHPADPARDRGARRWWRRGSATARWPAHRADRGHGQGPPQEHPPEARRRRPDRSGHHGLAARLHSARVVRPTSNVVLA